jgi:hypothetical protein
VIYNQLRLERVKFEKIFLVFALNCFAAAGPAAKTDTLTVSLGSIRQRVEGLL